jgi:hypothetical protein
LFGALVAEEIDGDISDVLLLVFFRQDIHNQEGFSVFGTADFGMFDYAVFGEFP